MSLLLTPANASSLWEGYAVMSLRYDWPLKRGTRVGRAHRRTLSRYFFAGFVLWWAKQVCKIENLSKY